MIDVSLLNKILKSFARMKRPNPREIKERNIAFEDYLFCGLGFVGNCPCRASFGQFRGSNLLWHKNNSPRMEESSLVFPSPRETKKPATVAAG
jgi:hypothetical protein